MTIISRRKFLRNAILGAATVGSSVLVAGCAKDLTKSGLEAGETRDNAAQTQANILSPTQSFDAKTGHNFSVDPDATTKIGSSLDNLKAAVQGETNATTKYAAWSVAARKEGYDQLARLFEATADAEKIHIALEMSLIKKAEPSYAQPAGDKPSSHASDINLIKAAQGEIYETSDMYSSFIKVAQMEKNIEAENVFTRAKLAEAYHAQHYLDAYNTIDVPSADTYYLCPICGYTHKGNGFTACPICLTSKDQFKSY